jgi:hypothetical protein
MEGEVFHEDRRTDMNLTVDPRNFAQAPEKIDFRIK